MNRSASTSSSVAFRRVLGLVVLVLAFSRPGTAGPGEIRPIDPGIVVGPILPLPSAIPGIEGDWVNVDPDTGGITRLVIRREPGLTLVPRYAVHAYGACVPADCDWGEVPATQSGATLTAVYEPEFKTATLTIRLVDDLLEVHAENVFHDGTGRDYEADYAFRLAWSADDMIGSWVNVDPSTDGMTAVVIDKPGALYTVHGFGACVPTDCDWGPEPAWFVRGGLRAVHEPGFKTNTMTVRLLPGGLLGIHSENVFHDGTDRDYVAETTFRRAWEPDDLLGEWVNVDPATGGLTRMTIERPDRFVVHGFGACVPSDCDWGEEGASILRNGLLAVYEPGFKVNTLTIRLLRDGRLHVHSVNEFIDGTDRDYVADYYLRRALVRPAPRFLRGDADSSGAIEVTDAIFTLKYLFGGETEPACAKAADANDNGDVNLSDPIQVLQFLFLGGEPLPPPSAGCGVDPTLDSLPCETALACS